MQLSRVSPRSSTTVSMRTMRVWYRTKEYERAHERTVRIDTVVLERGETLLNCIDVNTAEARQLRLHKLDRAEIVEAPRDPDAAPKRPPIRMKAKR